jgi:SPP1 family predicted phage head-tail adaptor
MTKPISIGDLRTRLLLEAPVRTGDGAGGWCVAWTTVAEVWAALRPLAGDEGLVLDRVAGTLRYEIVIRHRADVTLQMRLRDGARSYDIRSAFDPDGRRHWLKCIADATDL